LQVAVFRDFVQSVLKMFVFLSILHDLKTLANFVFFVLKMLAMFAVMLPAVIVDIGRLGLGRRERQGEGGQGEETKPVFEHGNFLRMKDVG
jgi:hypothetical protein